MQDETKAGLIATGGAGAGLVGTTATLSAPTMNLGGYATAQIVASKVGLGGPWLSVAIKSVGGPMLAGSVASLGVGFATWGVWKLGRESWRRWELSRPQREWKRQLRRALAEAWTKERCSRSHLHVAGA